MKLQCSILHPRSSALLRNHTSRDIGMHACALTNAVKCGSSSKRVARHMPMNKSVRQDTAWDTCLHPVNKEGWRGRGGL